MEAKHTKGEWTTEDCSNGGLIVCLGDTKSWDSQRVQIASKANAKLIAAAPELLEALIEAQITINIYCNNKIGDGSQNGRLMEQIQNAINKATK